MDTDDDDNDDDDDDDDILDAGEPGGLGVVTSSTRCVWPGRSGVWAAAPSVNRK